MRGRAAVLALALGLLAGCSSRERTNPFDPANPRTHGAPVGFAAVAGDHLVALGWEPAAGAGLSGFQLFRRDEGDSLFRPLGPVLPGDTPGYLDFPLTDGRRYDYRLYFVFSRGLGPRPAEDSATPGPLVPWVVEQGNGALDRLSADGRHVAFTRSGFVGPVDVQVDPITGRVWVSDPGFGRVTVYDPGLGLAVAITGLLTPSAIAVDPADHTAWVCDEGLNAVYHFTPRGAPAVPAALAPLATPIGVALDPLDGSVWVCERGQNRVRHFSAGGTPLSSTAVDAPSRVAVDSTTREPWVTSFDRAQVLRLAPTGAPRDTVGSFLGPIGVAVDPRRGRVWVADARANGIVALGRDGSVQFRVGALIAARAIAIDRASGEAWVACTGEGTVVRVSPAGAVVERAGGLNQPYGIALAGGR